MMDNEVRKENKALQQVIGAIASYHRLGLLLVGACLLWLLVPLPAQAATGIIGDDAHVLDTTVIRQYTDPFSFPVNVFTTTTFQGSPANFDASARGLVQDGGIESTNSCDPAQRVGCEPLSLSGDSSSGYAVLTGAFDQSRSVVIAIDVPARHLAIYAGSGVTLPQDHYGQAITAFQETMHQTHNDYTQATIAALNALESAGDRFWEGVGSHLPLILFGALVLGAIILSRMAHAHGWNGWGGSSTPTRDSESWSGGSGDGESSHGSDHGGGGGASGNF